MSILWYKLYVVFLNYLSLSVMPNGNSNTRETRKEPVNLVNTKTIEITINRTFSLGGHVESQENKKLCFCTVSLALNSRVAEVSRAKTKLFSLLRLNMAAE